MQQIAGCTGSIRKTKKGVAQGHPGKQQGLAGPQIWARSSCSRLQSGRSPCAPQSRTADPESGAARETRSPWPAERVRTRAAIPDSWGATFLGAAQEIVPRCEKAMSRGSLFSHTVTDEGPGETMPRDLGAAQGDQPMGNHGATTYVTSWRQGVCVPLRLVRRHHVGGSAWS